MSFLRIRFDSIIQQIAETTDPIQLESLQNQLDGLRKFFPEENPTAIVTIASESNIPSVTKVKYRTLHATLSILICQRFILLAFRSNCGFFHGIG